MHPSSPLDPHYCIIHTASPLNRGILTVASSSPRLRDYRIFVTAAASLPPPYLHHRHIFIITASSSLLRLSLLPYHVFTTAVASSPPLHLYPYRVLLLPCHVFILTASSLCLRCVFTGSLLNLSPHLHYALSSLHHAFTVSSQRLH